MTRFKVTYIFIILFIVSLSSFLLRSSFVSWQQHTLLFLSDPPTLRNSRDTLIAYKTCFGFRSIDFVREKSCEKSCFDSDKFDDFVHANAERTEREKRTIKACLCIAQWTSDKSMLMHCTILRLTSVIVGYMLRHCDSWLASVMDIGCHKRQYKRNEWTRNTSTSHDVFYTFVQTKPSWLPLMQSLLFMTP
jgi:hypothetical protein